MWLFTDRGFYSIVQPDGDDPDTLVVRARDRESLEIFEDDARIVELPNRDYPFRVFLPRDYVARWLEDEVLAGITYDNFKDAHTRGRVWHDALLQVWTAMHQVTPISVRRRRIKAAEAARRHRQDGGLARV